MKTKSKKIVRRSGFPILVWAILGILPLEGSAQTIEKWMPKTRHYAALERRQDCSVYQSVMAKMGTELTQRQELFSQVSVELKKRRADLELCATERGILGSIDDENEVYLAQVCSEQYDLWLTPGYRLDMVRQEIKALQKGLAGARVHVTGQCPVTQIRPKDS